MTIEINPQAPATILTVSDAARAQLSEILSQEADSAGLFLRVFVDGARAAMALDDVQHEDDIVMDFDGLKVVVDFESAPYLTGATIGYQETLMNRGFTIENANLPEAGGGCCGGSCGCGGH